MDIQKLIDQKERLNMSSAELSMRSGVPLSTVYKIFQGRTMKPHGDTLWALEEALGFYHTDEDPQVIREESTYGSYNAGTEAKKDYHKKQGEYTIEDYYNWPEDRRIELIDGVIYYLDEIVDGRIAGPHGRHQIVSGDLYTKLRQFVEENKGECVVLTAPLDVQLDEEDDDIVQPDLMIICDKAKFKGHGIVGAPDFVAEIISPSSKDKDSDIKLVKYKRAGVREYWVLNPERKTVQTYVFGEINKVDFHDFNEDIPVAIYDGKCTINLSKTAEFLDSVYKE